MTTSNTTRPDALTLTAYERAMLNVLNNTVAAMGSNCPDAERSLVLGTLLDVVSSLTSGSPESAAKYLTELRERHADRAERTARRAAK